MSQLLLELFSEEIPARMQAGAARDLARLAREHLARADLAFESLESFAGPRRLTLVVDGLPARQPDYREERRGPRLGAPQAAIEGFARSVGLAVDALAQAGGYWCATLERKGEVAGAVVAQMVDTVIGDFPWPKSMTWGDGNLRWIRPLHRVVCLLDGRAVPVAIEGVEVGNVTEGHRFMGARQPFPVSSFADYESGLAEHFVVVDVRERKRRIVDGARAQCAAAGLHLVDDEGLLDEVAGMTEWPVPLLGRMDPAFLTLPPEVVRTTMRTHQRYFATRQEGEAGALAPYFIIVANIEARDGGALIAAGAARVLAARLEDAKFFWNEDLGQPLESRLERLSGVTFHAKLGSMRQRAGRLEALAGAIAPLVGADADAAATAGRLAKADLVTAMVGEFPELQGVMGGYYAAAQGLDARIVAAIRDHYQPRGPSEAAPNAPATIAVALADKIDTILGFFSIGEKPTGSRDPFALRRAALGVIRILRDNRLEIPLGRLFALSTYPNEGVLEFFVERLKVLLREEGSRHDLVDAVFALGDDNLVRIARRVGDLAAFLATNDGANLLAAYKRAGNILDAEARKGDLPEGAARRPPSPEAEVALFDAIAACEPGFAASMDADDYAGALRTLASLRATVDAFFDQVLVNSLVAEERDNRLKLLGSIRRIMRQAADFSLIAGQGTA
jgi:glycyl-tRNA synthetase beta chain